MDTISISVKDKVDSQNNRILINFEGPLEILEGIKRYFENGQKIPITFVSYIKEYYDLSRVGAKVLKTMKQETFSLDDANDFDFLPRNHKPWIFISDDVVNYFFLIPFEPEQLDVFYTKMTLPAKSANKRGPSKNDTQEYKRQRSAAARLLQHHDIETAAQMLAQFYF